MPRGPLYATLTRAALHRKLSLTLRMLLLAGAGLLVATSVVLAADNLFNLKASTRTIIAVAFPTAIFFGFARLFWLYWRQPTDSARMAVYLEQRYGINDNRLINAVHFDKEPGLPAYIKDIFVVSAESACNGLKLGRVWQHAKIKSAVIWCGMGLFVFLAYVIPFGGHAKNAFVRFLNPSTRVMPLNFTQFNVEPGNVELIEGSSCLIRAEASKSGRPAPDLKVVLDEGGAPLLYPMRTRGEGFVFELHDLTRSTRYLVRNGNDDSRAYTIRVIPRPRLPALKITVTPPEYTDDEPWTIESRKHEVEILEGSGVSINTGVSGKREAVIYRDQEKASGINEGLSFQMDADTAVSIDVKDERGLMHAGVWKCRLIMAEDRTPTVRFLNRELNVEATAGERLPLTLEERDDFGLTAMELFTVKNGEAERIKRLNYRDVRRERTGATPLSLDETFFARNATYKIWARVFDNHHPPQAGVVPVPLTLHIIDPTKGMELTDKDDPYVKLFALLTEALNSQKALRDWTAARIARDRKKSITQRVRKRQGAVHSRISEGAVLALTLFEAKKIRKSLNERISDLKTRYADPLMLRIPQVANLDAEKRQAGLNEIVLTQTEIIAALQGILGAVSQQKTLEDVEEQRLAEEEQEQELFKKLTALKEDISRFKEAQRKMLSDTEAIDKKEPEDWTEEEEKLLGDLAAREQDFATFFQAAFNDLSKLQNQDFSNSTMADELVEMIEELQKAGAALEKKHVEIATVNEALLGEQAESIETNLERWLADAKDHIKWNGEESGVMPDVPLQDLPDELTDIIGELIDSVEEMEDVEDSTGSSLSAFDEGIGWGVSDGNMDDMSAKGITGNIMPNNNEVGGRSGEGRSGKSSGQFVEKEAHGKGGRDTPTRLVQSPFEKGTVRDNSEDPQGGATGGGKQSGLGGNGLRGITPDQKPDIQKRLPGQQAELKQKAEALLRELNVRNLPTGDLEEAVNKMEQIQRLGSSGRGLHVRQIQSELISTLKDARTTISSGVMGGVERTKKMNLKVATVRHPDHESTPAGYKESVDAYFHALAE